LKYYSKKKKNGKIRKILLSLMIIIVAISLVDAVDIYKNRNKILPGVSAFGVELEGLKKEKAREILQPIASKMIDSPRILVFENKEIKFIPHTELGTFIDLNQVVEETYGIARTGNIFRRIKDRIVVWRKGYEVPFQAEFNPQKFEDFQNKIISLINRMPSDAYVDGNRIIESRIGVKLDLEKLKEEITESLKSLDEEKYIFDIPFITSEANLILYTVFSSLFSNEVEYVPNSLLIANSVKIF